MTDEAQDEVRDNADESRFELSLDGHLAVAEYNRTETGLVIASTLVPKPIEGRGVAGRLYTAIVAAAREKGLRLIPVCPVFALWLRRHPEAHDVIDPGFRRSLGLSAEPG